MPMVHSCVQETASDISHDSVFIIKELQDQMWAIIKELIG